MIADRIRIARELGATDRDLAPILNKLLFEPLTGLNEFQDKGVISIAEKPEEDNPNKR